MYLCHLRIGDFFIHPTTSDLCIKINYGDREENVLNLNERSPFYMDIYTKVNIPENKLQTLTELIKILAR